MEIVLVALAVFALFAASSIGPTRPRGGYQPRGTHVASRIPPGGGAGVDFRRGK